MIEFRCSLCLTLLENPSVCITSRSERERQRERHSYEAEQINSSSLQDSSSARQVHTRVASAGCSGAADEEDDDDDDDDEDSPDHRSRAADRVIAAAARDSSRYMSSARAGAITVSPHLRFRSDGSSEESRVIE